MADILLKRYYNIFMVVYDTYLPAELEKILSNLKLNGRIITKIESPSYVFGSIKKDRLDIETGKYETWYKDAEIDMLTLLTLDDGRRIGFDFSSASHVSVHINPDFDIEKEAECKEGDVSVASIFSKIVGKKIKDFYVKKDDDVNKILKHGGFIDGGFNYNQDFFITHLGINLEDGGCLYFENNIDFTLVCYKNI